MSRDLKSGRSGVVGPGPAPARSCESPANCGQWDLAAHRGCVATAILLLALGLVATNAWAAKPEKPNGKPDKIERGEKPDKVPKPEKVDKMDRTSKSERTSLTPASGGERSSKFGRSSRGGNSSAAPAAAPATPAGNDFDAFQIVTERNIFNPNRVPRPRGNDVEPPRIDTVTLVGVLQSDTGVIAFFNSPDRSLTTTLREGETIGGLPLSRILPNGVELMQEGQRLTLRVNQQMRRVNGGAWNVIPRDIGRGDMARADPNLPVIPPGASEVLRRLMEQRQKQLKQ